MIAEKGKKRNDSLQSILIEVLIIKLPIYTVIGIIFLSFSVIAEAHWSTTHQFMIDLACKTLENDGKRNYCDFLQNSSYIDSLKQGIYDADMRVNGIYSVDKHCVDITTNQCEDSEKVSNDIPAIIIGDHGYNPNSKKGFSSLKQSTDRVKADWQGWIKSGDPLIGELKGKTTQEKKKYLLNLMQKVNAGDLADFFYNQAMEEWEKGNETDAFYNLGIALHALQDLTVPHHSRLMADSQHSEYERFVWEEYLKKIPLHSITSGLYIDQSPKEWVAFIAKKSYKWDLNNPSKSATESVSLGVASTAGFLVNFLYQANNREIIIDRDQGIKEEGNDWYAYQNTAVSFFVGSKAKLNTKKKKGYLNSFDYARTNTRRYYPEDMDYGVTNWWIYYPNKSMVANIYAFIPNVFRSQKSKNAYYDLSLCDGDSCYWVTDVFIDQSSINDDWILLFENIRIPYNGVVLVTLDNETGEKNKYVIFDAVKIVAQ